MGFYAQADAFQPAAFSQGKTGNPRQMNFQYFAPYFQDDWKVTPRLTLNLGLRYDFRTMPYETSDHFGWWDSANTLGGMLVADKQLQEQGIIGPAPSFYRLSDRRTPHDAPKNVFAPRFGFAYRPFDDDKTVVRGGYGIFIDSAEEREIDGSADIYPYVSRGVYVQTVQPAPCGRPMRFFPSRDPGPVTPAANRFLAVSQSHHRQNPYAQQWSFSVQRALSVNSTLEVYYSAIRVRTC